MVEKQLLLSPRDAAKALGISERTLWRLTFEQTPALPHVRLGRSVRYRPEDLETYIESKRKEPKHG